MIDRDNISYQMRMDRNVSTQDISWFIDLEKSGRLDLSPAYQRKSVWSLKDRRFFIDTVLNNYPAPAIFLHKEVDPETGQAIYHVVDGKQRLQSILAFVNNKFALATDFSDSRYASKRFRDIEDADLRRMFWDYKLIVEYIGDANATITEVFSRLNRNQKALTRQELRHARFTGWLGDFLAEEADQPLWTTLKINTTARIKRMTNIQNLAELFAQLEHGGPQGFSQDQLDDLYLRFDSPEDEEFEFDDDEMAKQFDAVRSALAEFTPYYLKSHPRTGNTFAHLYTLFGVLSELISTTSDVAKQIEVLGLEYEEFISMVNKLGSQGEITGDSSAAKYAENAVGASTELPQREARHAALLSVFHGALTQDEN